MSLFAIQYEVVNVSVFFLAFFFRVIFNIGFYFIIQCGSLKLFSLFCVKIIGSVKYSNSKRDPLTKVEINLTVVIKKTIRQVGKK